MGTRKRNPSARRRRRSGGDMPSWLGPTIGTVVALGVLIGAGTLIYRALQSRWTEITEYLDPGNRFDLTYLPPDADFYIVVRGAALRRSESVHAFVESAGYREGLEPGWELLGLSPENVDTATFGAVGFGRQLDRVLSGEAVAPGFVTVIRTLEPVEQISAREPLVASEEVAHGGRSYVRINGPTTDSGRRALGSFSVDARTVVFGSEEQVQATLERLEQGMPTPRRTELDFVNPEQHVVIVALSEGAGEAVSAVDSATTGRPFPDSFRDFVGSLDHMPDQYSLGLKFAANDIIIEALCQFENDSRRAAFVERVGQIRTTAGNNWLRSSRRTTVAVTLRDVGNWRRRDNRRWRRYISSRVSIRCESPRWCRAIT